VPVTSTVVTIDGSSLTCAQVAAVARQRAGVAVGEAAVAAQGVLDGLATMVVAMETETTESR
jgi:hypothetical protein